MPKDNLLLGPATISADDFFNNSSIDHFAYNQEVLERYGIDAALNYITDIAANDNIHDWTNLSTSADKRLLDKGGKALFSEWINYTDMDYFYRSRLGNLLIAEAKDIISEYEIGPEEFHINWYNHYDYWLDIVCSNGYVYKAKTDDLLITEHLWLSGDPMHMMTVSPDWNELQANHPTRSTESFAPLVVEQITLMEILAEEEAPLGMIGADISPVIKTDYLNTMSNFIKSMMLEIDPNKTKKTMTNNLADLLISQADLLGTVNVNYHLTRIRSLLLILSDLRKTLPKNNDSYKVKANIDSSCNDYSRVLKKAGLKKVRHAGDFSSIKPLMNLISLSNLLHYNGKHNLDYDLTVNPRSTDKIELDICIARLILIFYLPLHVKAHLGRIVYRNGDKEFRPINSLDHHTMTFAVHRYVFSLSRKDLLSIISQLKITID